MCDVRIRDVESNCHNIRNNLSFVASYEGVSKNSLKCQQRRQKSIAKKDVKYFVSPQDLKTNGRTTDHADDVTYCDTPSFDGCDVICCGRIEICAE